MGSRFIQAATNENAAGATTITATMAKVVTQGDLLVVGVGNNAAQSVSSVTDTLGNSYSQAVTATSNQRVSIWYSLTTKGGAAPVVTATFSASSANRRICAAEYNCDGLAPLVLDGTNSKTNASTTTPDSGSVTPTKDGAIFVGVLTPNNFAVGPVTPGTNFSERFEAAADGWDYEDLVQATAASLSATWTTSVADPSTCAVAVFVPNPRSIYSAAAFPKPEFKQAYDVGLIR